MSKYPAVCLVWLKLWREQWNNCIYFKMPLHTARFLARKHPFQFSYEGSNYLARHLRGSCLKGRSRGENTDRLAVWLEEITVITALRRIKTLTMKLVQYSVSAEASADMVQAYSASAWPLPQNPKASPKYRCQTSATCLQRGLTFIWMLTE